MLSPTFTFLNFKPLFSSCVTVTFWLFPKSIWPPNARYKSDHSAEADPNAAPSAEAGVIPPENVDVPVDVIAPHPTVPSPLTLPLVSKV